MTDDFEDFVAHQTPGLLRFAFVLTGRAQDAEDLCQDVLVRAYRHRKRLLDADNPEAYAHRMLTNEYLRRARRAKPVLVEEGDRADEEVGFAHVDDREMLNGALKTLPERQRVALVLRYLEDRDYREVAAIIGCRESSARTLVRRGLQRLQDSYRTNGFGK